MALPLPLPPASRQARIRTPLFLLGVAMALLAFIAMFAFGILFANRGLSGGQVTTVVAAQDIQAREPITASMLTVAHIPQAQLSPHAIVNLSDLDGATALGAALRKARETGPALFVLPTAYDAGEAIPPYSERPDEIRLKWSRALGKETSWKRKA